MNLKLLGRIIKEERKLMHLSQIEISTSIFINQSTLSRLERGEILSLEQYRKVLALFGIELFEEEKGMSDLLDKLYLAMEFDDSDEASKSYLDSLSIKKLSYTDFYIKRLINALYLLYTRQIVHLVEFFPYLDVVEYVFTDKLLKYVYLIKGYVQFIHKNYELANEEFNKINPYLELDDNILNYIYSLNLIFLGHFDVAQFYLEKSKISSIKKQNGYRLIHLNRLLAYIYFLSSNYEECITLASKYLLNDQYDHTSELTYYQTNLYAAASNFLLKKYKESQLYFENLIQNSLFLTDKYNYLIYTYYLICLKQTNHDLSNFLQGINQYANVMSPSKIEIMKLFIQDYELSNSQLSEFFNTTCADIHDYLHAKIIATLMKSTLWEKRKYRLYKKFDDRVIKRGFRSN